MSHISRCKIKKDIICEFVKPPRKSSKVIIIAGGLPTYPGKHSENFEKLAEKGYWVFVPRYRGSWESGGKMFKKSADVDIKDCVDHIFKNKIVDLWDLKSYKIQKPKVFLVGGSFGGPAVLLNAHDERVKKVVAIAPVVDWKNLGPDEPFPHFYRFTREAFGEGYRFNKEDFNKLKTGKFYNPMNETSKIPGDKVLVISTEDDMTVLAESIREFVEKIDCKLVMKKTGGHIGTGKIFELKLWPYIDKFFSGK